MDLNQGREERFVYFVFDFREFPQKGLPFQAQRQIQK
jgi:hypothetical protein